MEMMIEHFPFLDSGQVDLTLRLCSQNNRLFYSPGHLLGFYQFYPELINVVRNQEFEVLMQCDLTEGPLVYVAVLITPGNALRIISEIVRALNARGYAFHRYRQGEYQFHFVRNNRYGQNHARYN